MGGSKNGHRGGIAEHARTNLPRDIIGYVSASGCCAIILVSLISIFILASATGSAAAPLPLAEFPSGLDPNPMLLPPRTEDGLVKVNVALHVLNLSDMNEVTERFRLTGYLLAQWHDSRLTYESSGPGDRFRALAPDSVWRPKLVIINVAAPRQVYEESLRVEPDGVVSYIERFDALVSSTFHLKSFPFDTQKLEILVHPFANQQQFVVFTPSELPVWTAAEFASYSSLDSWNFQSLTFELRKATGQLRKSVISEARFQITVARRYGFYLWKVFLPLLLMGNRVMVGVLVRSAGSIEPGADCGNLDTDDHRVRARDIADAAAHLVPDVCRRLFSDLLYIRIRLDARTYRGAHRLSQRTAQACRQVPPDRAMAGANRLHTYQFDFGPALSGIGAGIYRLPCRTAADDEPYIRNTPKLVAGGMPALSEAAMLSASIARVSKGSITPSSHSRALEK
jgi:hypothetical protein